MQSGKASNIFDTHFEGKVVIVTGAASGIGQAIAEGFAYAGASVRLVDRSEQVQETAAAAAAEGLKTSAATCDVTDEVAVRALIAGVEQDFGRLDVLVNNAGIITIDPLGESTTADFERVLAVNTTAMFITAREAHQLMQRSGGGSIINAASGQSRQGFIYTPGYAASKFGVMGLTQSLAKELAASKARKCLLPRNRCHRHVVLQRSALGRPARRLRARRTNE